MSKVETPDSARASRRFIQTAMAKPLLTQEREAELARKWREEGHEPSLHELTTAYVRLVIAVAARFRNYGIPMADLVQEGNVGLMQAAARFEPEREVRFSTYATWWIRSAIQDHILRNWSIVRTGTTAAQKSLFFNLRRLRALIRDGAEPHLSPEGRETIAKKLGVSVAEVETMESRLSAADRSLNAQIGEDGDAEWQDLIADGRPLPEEEVMGKRDAAQRKRWIAKALKRLSARELMIIKERRLQDETVTLESLGRRLGISKERVRQIEHQALMKLKAALVEIAGDPGEAGLIGT
ncbi:MAG: RNA polymerase factor sigma-32 [Alphaproteobacteria bacterium]|nr:RNA polymerase factor sigma-32 [Alphaproteobacteria bacterium]